MKLRNAIKLAKKYKCRIKNKGIKHKGYVIPMLEQDAKSLILWLILDTKSDKQAIKKLKQWLKSTDWKLDYSGCAR